MKFNSTRYAMTAAMCVIAVTSMVIAADFTPAKWFIAVIGSALSGLVCASVIPWEQRGDK